MSKDRYVAVHRELLEYPCGLRAGDRLRLRSKLTFKDHMGRATGESREAGEIWTILAGSESEPDIIWLEQADGDAHTWDADDILDSFEPVSDG